MRRAVTMAAVVTMFAAPHLHADEREDAWRDRVRRALLAQGVSHVVEGGRLHVRLENAVNGAFRLVEAAVTLDGAPIYRRRDDPIAPRVFEVFSGMVVPGDHVLAAELTYRGEGYGVFTYLRGYTMRVRGRCALDARERQSARVLLRAAERGSVVAPSGDPPRLLCVTP
jgi:hypothetical protein